MKLFTLSVALVATAACASSKSATNINSFAPLTGKSDTAVSADPYRKEACLNLNIATAGDLTKIPGIGQVIAQRIIEYRERHGRFRRPQEIIIIEGFSERKYRAIAGMICVE